MRVEHNYDDDRPRVPQHVVRADDFYLVDGATGRETWRASRAPRQPDDPGNVTEADRAAVMAPADRAIVVMWVMAFVAVACLALALWFSPAHSRPHPLDVARAGVACVGVTP